MKEVTIAVPIYLETMSDMERISFERLRKVLGHYRTVIIKPDSLDLSDLLSEWPGLETENFDDRFFKGVSGYNSLMMSEEFYSRFQDSEYILIYQLDAYVFKDELNYWCSQGYDYVGAPWIPRMIHRCAVMRLAAWAKKVHCNRTGKPNRHIVRYKVGNGGFSLRRVDSHLKAVRQLKDTVDRFLASPGHPNFNEDVFFSLEVNRHGLNFRYPDWKEALRFSFDMHPRACFIYNHRQLPFGCHGWYKKKARKFWASFILR